MKKRLITGIIICIATLLFIPSNVNGKELTTEKVICKYKYQGETTKELVYKIYDNKVETPFKDGENNWYHGQDFVSNYLISAKTNSINYVCPTITIEESSLFTTVFNNPVTEEDCNGKCTTLVAKETLSTENITVNKAVATTAIGSVGIYDDTKYFIPYFRLLKDGTKEWSINGKKFISIDSSAVLKTSNTDKTVIKLDTSLIDKIFKDKTLNTDVTIYRNVKSLSKNEYEYLLATSKIKEYNLTDGQETASKSYKGSLGTKDAEKDSLTKDEMDDWLDDYGQTQDCNSLLGSTADENSVAWLIQQIFNYIKLLAPLIVVIMSGIDFAKVIVMGDDDGMKKAQTKLIIRLILAASLFFLPDLIMALLDLFGLTTDGICALE